MGKFADFFRNFGGPRADSDDRSPWGSFWFEPVTMRTVSKGTVTFPPSVCTPSNDTELASKRVDSIAHRAKNWMLKKRVARIFRRKTRYYHDDYT